MKDPKAIRKAIMTAKSIASLIDPHFGRVPLPNLGKFGADEPLVEHSPMIHAAYGEPMPKGFARGGKAKHKILAYHGTSSNFDDFDTNLSRGGSYFTTDKSAAEYYAQDRARKLGGTPRVVEAMLHLNNPFHSRETNDYVYDIHHAKSHGHDAVIGPAIDVDPEIAPEHLVPKNIAVWDRKNIEILNHGHEPEHFARGGLPTLKPAIRHKGKVYSSIVDHLSALSQIEDPEEYRNARMDAENRGYVNERGHFMDRYRAQGYAKDHGLVRHDAPEWAHSTPELISENLMRYPEQEERNQRLLSGEGFAAGGDVDDQHPYAQPDDLGLYSHAAVTAAGLPQERGTPEQFRGMLLNKGVKPDEMKWGEYDYAFGDKPMVNRDEIAQHFAITMPPIEETILGGHNSASIREKMKLKHRDEINSIWDDDSLDRDEQDRLLKQTRNRHREELRSVPYDDPHHEEYTLPGGENYREILLKHGAEDKFPGVPGHFGGEPDILTSLRMKDRKDSEGRKVLHLDELQSDWGQQAHEHGQYSPKEFEEYLRSIEQRAAPLVAEEFGIPESTAHAKMPEWTRTGYLKHQNLAEMLGEGDDYHDKWIDNQSRKNSEVSDAPYIGKTEGWMGLGLKRALLEAAKGDHEKLAWTPGDMQADRYPGGSDEDEAKRRAGMIHFYDKMLPKALLKLAKLHDPEASISHSVIEHPLKHYYEENEGKTSLPALEITPKMRESILKKGFPAYADGGEVEGYADGGDIDIEKFREHLKRIHSPLSEDPASVQKALKIAGSYRSPTGMETGTGSLYNIKQSMPASDVRATIGDIPGISMKKPQKKSWEDFYKRGKGGVFINMGGDLSNFGRLTHINDKELAWPVDLHAGTKFMLEPNPGYVWGNAAGHSTAFDNKIRAAEEAGHEVFGAFSPMGPSAVNSSHNMFDALMAQIPNAGIDKKHMREFDEAIKRGDHLDASIKKEPKKLKAHLDALKAWPGIENAKEASEFARPEAGNLTGTHRTMLVKFMDKADWLKKGFPEVGVTRSAITDPELKGVGGNKIGHRIVKLTSEKMPGARRAFEHSTYPTYTGGEYVMDVPLVQRHYASPDVIDQMVAKPTKAGQVVHPFSEDTLGRATARKLFEEQKQVQPINQRMLDSVMTGMENQEKYGFKKGGAVRRALMIAKGVKKK